MHKKFTENKKFEIKYFIRWNERKILSIRIPEWNWRVAKFEIKNVDWTAKLQSQKLIAWKITWIINKGKRNWSMWFEILNNARWF
jgi:hypothetical protein